MLAWERQRRLLDKLAHAREMAKLSNFDFEEWRKRFMRFANQKKLRITDLFRRMDLNNDGFLEKYDFVDGIIKTNFPTSRPEMQLVADLVDKNQDGVIDYVEFMSALKPDWEKNRPLTEAERIDDEVKKACAACTCRSKFKVYQVGEGKYRFGDSQKLRLVRILRSTVMVRVGGGWEALDEFLVKNDPCRAKGRTNVELREQFVLAPGVSQTMTPFRSKQRDTTSPSSQSRLSTPGLPTAGPITKIREKTSRSIPLSRGTLSGAGDSTARKSSTPLRGGSGSRPGSRAGSELSLDSVDGRTNGSRALTQKKHSSITTPSIPLTTRSPSSDNFSMQRRSVKAASKATPATASASSRTSTPLTRKTPSLNRSTSSQSIPAKLAAPSLSREGSRSRIAVRASGSRLNRSGSINDRPRWQ